MSAAAQSSAVSALRFAASYHRPPGAPRPQPAKPSVPPSMAALHTRERWAWFRIGVLTACLTWTRSTAALFERFSIDRRIRIAGIRRDSSGGRVARRNLAFLVRRGYLLRCNDGYRTTARGRRVLGDLAALQLLDGAA